MLGDVIIKHVVIVGFMAQPRAPTSTATEYMHLGRRVRKCQNTHAHVLKGCGFRPSPLRGGGGASLTRCEKLKLKNSILVRVLRGGKFCLWVGVGGGGDTISPFAPPPPTPIPTLDPPRVLIYFRLACRPINTYYIKEGLLFLSQIA